MNAQDSDPQMGPTRIFAMLVLVMVLAGGGYFLSNLAGHSPVVPDGRVRSVLDGRYAPIDQRPFNYLRFPSKLHPKPISVAVEGQTTQGDLTLVGCSDSSGDPDLPDKVVSLAEHRLVNTLQTGPGVALWIKTRQSLGIRYIPIQPGVTFRPVGDYILKTKSLSTSADTALSVPVRQWYGRQGNPIPYGEPEPYRVEPIWSTQANQIDLIGKCRGELLLIPRDIERSARVTVTPKSSDGHPCSPSARLRVQIAGRNLLFIRVPAGYAHSTRSLTVAAADAAGEGEWRLTNLPDSLMTLPGQNVTRDPTKVGALALSANVTESTDRWFPWTPPTEQDAHLTAWNADDHYACGLPTLRCEISARNLEKVSRDAWRIAVSSVTPQWTPQSGPIGQCREDLNPIIAPPGCPPVTRLYAVGTVYPGQQHYVVVRGTAERIHEAVEYVTLHDADLCYSRSSHRWILQWQSPQMVQTPSGIVIVPFNRRLMDDMAAADQDPAWTALNAAEFDLGIRTKSHIGAEPYSTTFDFKSPLNAVFTIHPRDVSGTFWVPGASAPVVHTPARSVLSSPLFPYCYDGFVASAVALTGNRHGRCSPSDDDIPICPLPAHIDTLRFAVRTRAVVERHDFTMTVPVTQRLITTSRIAI